MIEEKMSMDEATMRIKELERQVESLQEELAQVTEMYKKVKERRFNERGAGRKKNDAKWQARFQEFVQLFEAHKTEAEIEADMKISRSTYYRFKKHHLEAQK